MRDVPPALSAVDQVETALKVMSSSTEALSRIALASVLSEHGEYAWHSEIVYQLDRAGAAVLSQARAGGLTKIDFVVEGVAFEIKSSFWSYALKQLKRADIFTKTDEWIGQDIRKLRRGSCQGHVLITMATLLTAKHRVAGELSRIRADRDGRPAERERALAYYLDYGHHVGAFEVRDIPLGRGVVPNDGGELQLDVLILNVRDPSRSR